MARATPFRKQEAPDGRSAPPGRGIGGRGRVVVGVKIAVVGGGSTYT
ncbi:MAG: hypothetical protein U0838_16760 [Chloroflexota bacterium]